MYEREIMKQLDGLDLRWGGRSRLPPLEYPWDPGPPEKFTGSVHGIWSISFISFMDHRWNQACVVYIYKNFLGFLIEETIFKLIYLSSLSYRYLFS